MNNVTSQSELKCLIELLRCQDLFSAISSICYYQGI